MFVCVCVSVCLCVYVLRVCVCVCVCVMYTLYQLSESIDKMKFRLLNFAIVLVIFMVMFTSKAHSHQFAQTHDSVKTSKNTTLQDCSFA